ncbi:Kelch repeat-containing protein [Kutzneria chonburiensis]|uniref:Kelch repeat-containing protein n=1 Tax=Kutzneria chonburiensis TaxID=1483604 RepID=A0ABV6MQP8_9PSEU|nr:kelch repeat-containing protein [Kutzneria chonburiensis]
MSEGFDAMTTGNWASAGHLPAAASWRGQHDNAVRLADDTVLVAGGADKSGTPVNSAAHYTPSTKAWQGSTMLGARMLHALTDLDGGDALVTGGLATPNSPGLTTVERYDHTKNTWSQGPALQGGRWGHAAVRLKNKQVLVIGGATVPTGSDTVRALSTVELFDGTKWTTKAPMADARYGHTAVVFDNGQVLVCGGVTATGRGEAQLALCELYDPTNDKWSPAPSMAVARSHHQATLLTPTTVLVTGGAAPQAGGDGTFDPFSRKTAELYTQGGGWQAQATMPAGREFHRAAPLGNGKAVIVGGTDSTRNDTGFPSTLVYDPSAAQPWTTVTGLTAGRWGFAAVALADHSVLVLGGTARSGLAASTPDVDDLLTAAEVFTP